jgi:hypothetical protein
MALRLVPIVGLALAAGLCGGEDRVALLEARRRELLASTVEKKEFWTQVERKGAAAKRLRELEGQRADLEQESVALEARHAAVEPALAQARDVNGRAQAAEAELLAREEELAGRIRAAEETLARFAAGRPAEGNGG